MKESDLYIPVKKLFESMGYSVNAEVEGCDVTAVDGDELVIAELKRNLSVTLLAQGLNRQKTGAAVYVAVPKPKNYSPKNFRDTLYVLKKLELGLIFINIIGKNSYAEIILNPEEFKPVRQNLQKRKRILSEIDGRTVDTNTGGVTGKKIATAYTEKCIHIACILDKYGPMSANDLKKHGADAKKCYSIVYYNVYGWFCKKEKGIYDITTKGRLALLDYPELEKYYTELISIHEKYMPYSSEEN